MKLFVVAIVVAVLIMFVFAQDTAAAAAAVGTNEPEDGKDIAASPSGIFNGLLKHHSSPSSRMSSKSSGKNPIFKLLKSVIKLLKNLFASSESSGAPASPAAP